MKSYEEEVKQKIKNLEKILGFEIEEEWTPSTLKEKSREEFYIPIKFLNTHYKTNR